MKKGLMGLTLLALALTAGIAVRAVNTEGAKKSAAMNTYIIESKHTGPECMKALDDVNSKQLLDKSYWGCMTGDHRGWTTLQASSSEAALMMFPESQRASANVIQVSKFTPADLEAIHSGKKS